MKNQFIITLLCLSLIGTIAKAQTQKPTTTKKPSTTVKSSAPKTTTKTSTTTTTTIPNSTTAPVVVEEKKTTTTTTTNPSPSNSMNSNGSSSSTTIQQSSGPSKGGKKPADPKPDKVVEPKPEKVVKVKEPKPERMRNSSSSSDGRVRFGIRAEVTQAVTLESGGSYDLSPGVNAGLIVNLPISQVVSIQPEVLYSMTVIKYSSDANNYSKATTGSILVPLMVNFNFGQGSTKFMLNLGGYGDYLLNASNKVVAAGKTVLDGTLDITGEDKFDYGAAIGIGVKINGNFMIEARSFYGLKDNKGKNGLGTIGIGYFF